MWRTSKLPTWRLCYQIGDGLNVSFRLFAIGCQAPIGVFLAARAAMYASESLSVYGNVDRVSLLCPANCSLGLPQTGFVLLASALIASPGAACIDIVVCLPHALPSDRLSPCVSETSSSHSIRISYFDFLNLSSLHSVRLGVSFAQSAFPFPSASSASQSPIGLLAISFQFPTAPAFSMHPSIRA